MRFSLRIFLAHSGILLLAAVGVSEEFQRLSALESNYQLALERATSPITKKYIAELKKLKLQYTKAGDLAAANEAVKKLEELLPSPKSENPARLSEMDDKQFRKWLSSVTIRETEGPYLIRFHFDRDGVTTSKDGAPPREHSNATVNPEKIFVPFSSTNATIEIDESLMTANVSYSSGGNYKCVIEPKKDAE